MIARTRDQFRLISFAGKASILAVALAFLIMLALLYRTESNAADITGETAQIAKSGQGINSYTDSILQLNETNRLASSILSKTAPLHSSLQRLKSLSAQIDQTAGTVTASVTGIARSVLAIDGSAATIRHDVAAIESTTGDINASLSGVNGNASRILATAQQIKQGLDTISSSLDATVRVTSQILNDAQGINSGAGRTNHEAACIDNGLNGGPKC